jgi:type IV secretory pathway TrbD component
VSIAGAPQRRPRRLALFLGTLLLAAIVAALLGAWLVWGWGGVLLIAGLVTADILTRADVL